MSRPEPARDKETALVDDDRSGAGEHEGWLASSLGGEAVPCGCECGCRLWVDEPDDLRCFGCRRGEHVGPLPGARDGDLGSVGEAPPQHRTGHWWSWRR